MEIVLKVTKNPVLGFDFGDDGLPQSICSSCTYYGGMEALEAGLMCTVHPLGPELPANGIIGGRKMCHLHSRVYTYHNCQDFVRKQTKKN